MESKEKVEKLLEGRVLARVLAESAREVSGGNHMHGCVCRPGSPKDPFTATDPGTEDDWCGH